MQRHRLCKNLACENNILKHEISGKKIREKEENNTRNNIHGIIFRESCQMVIR